MNGLDQYEPVYHVTQVRTICAQGHCCPKQIERSSFHPVTMRVQIWLMKMDLLLFWTAMMQEILAEGSSTIQAIPEFSLSHQEGVDSVENSHRISHRHRQTKQPHMGFSHTSLCGADKGHAL